MTEVAGSSKDRLTPEKLEEYRGLLPMGRFIGVGGDALRALLDEIQACWDERNAPETDTHLCVECGWIKSRPENSAPAAAGPVIAEPSSEGSEPAAVGAGPTPLKANQQSPTSRPGVASDALGIAWWNGCSDAERAFWLKQANSAVPADAWQAYKNSDKTYDGGDR